MWFHFNICYRQRERPVGQALSTYHGQAQHRQLRTYLFVPCRFKATFLIGSGLFVHTAFWFCLSAITY